MAYNAAQNGSNIHEQKPT